MCTPPPPVAPQEYEAGFARSLLEARAALGREPFLLCTPDHIFDPQLVSAMRNMPLHGWDRGARFAAVALIDTEVQHIKAQLPTTAVRVRLRNSLVSPPPPPLARSPLARSPVVSPVESAGASRADSSGHLPAELVAVRHIGRSIGTPVHGIEAGLYACGPEVLAEIEAQAALRAYFTVAQASTASQITTARKPACRVGARRACCTEQAAA